jgi:hypothetical protein
MNNNNDEHEIYNYETSLINDLTYNDEYENIYKIMKLNNGDKSCTGNIILSSIFHRKENTKLYNLNFGKNYLIKKIYFKIDIDTYNSWINDKNFLYSLFNTDISITDGYKCSYKESTNYVYYYIDIKILDSLLFNKNINNSNLNNIIIDIYNFDKYLVDKMLYIEGWKSLKIKSDVILDIIDYIYIDYDFNNNILNTVDDSSNNIKFYKFNIIINKNTNSFNFECFNYSMYICICFDDNDDDNDIEEITVNNYPCVSFHKIYILEKPVYIIPLTFDLLDNIDNIHNYVYYNKNITNNKIYNDMNLFFKIYTTLDNCLSNIFAYTYTYYTC